MSTDDAGGGTRRLGRYHLGDPLGGGPTGEVYRAKVHGVAGFDRRFAIKSFHEELVRSPAMAAKVAGAARAYGGLEHPHIARLHEFGVSGGRTFTATELVNGVDLRALIRAVRGGLKPGSAAAVLAMTARAIGYAHGRGHAHLGLCPTNLLLTPDSSVKVTDFGVLPPRLPKRPAQDPTLDARLPYLAPEQLAGEPTSAATDVYQLGVLGFVLFTGRGPFHANSAFEHAQLILSGELPEPPLPKPIVRVLRRCLARSPFERYPEATALADAIDDAAKTAALPGSISEVGPLVSHERARLDGIPVDSRDLPRPTPPAARKSGSGTPAPRRVVRGGLSATALKRTMMAVAPPPPPRANPFTHSIPGPDSSVPEEDDDPTLSQDGFDLGPAGVTGEHPVVDDLSKAEIQLGKSDARAPTTLSPDNRDQEEVIYLENNELPLEAPESSTLRRARADSEDDEAQTAIYQGGTGAIPGIPQAIGARVLDDEDVPSIPSMPPIGAGGYTDGIPDGSGTHNIPDAPELELTGTLGAEPPSIDLETLGRPPSTIDPMQGEPTIPSPAPYPQAPPPYHEQRAPELPPVANGKKGGRALVIAALAAALIGGGGFAAYQLLASEDETTSADAGIKDETKVAVAATDASSGKPEIGTDATTAAETGDAATALASSDAASDSTDDAGSDSADAAPVALPDAAAVTATDGKSLIIASTPSGARVYLDGADVGETPLTLDASSDKHRIALILAGHKLHLAEVDGSSKLDIKLEEVTPTNGPAGIKVRCKKKNRYYVFVDGNDVGQVCPTERIGVNKGKHIVEIYDPVTDSRSQFNADVKQTRRSLRVRVD